MLDAPGSGASGEADERVPGLWRSVTSLMSFAGSADLFRYRVWGHVRFTAGLLTDRGCPCS